MIGQPAEAALVTLKIKPATSDDLENIAPYIDLCFAACEITRDLEAILCAADLEKLEDVSAYDVLKPTVVTESDVSKRKCVIGDENGMDVVNYNDDVTRSHDTLLGNVEIVKDDKDAQIESKACNVNNMSDDDPVSLDPVSRDPTLERAWVWAQKNKNNFFVKDELLYHRDKVLQQNVQQICLPTARRNEVCHLAHDMCHLGYKRTKEKLRLNFFWPGMSKTIREYVDTCLACQKKAKAVIKDRVPISIVPRDQVAFSHLYMDVVGPLLNKAEYNVCLCLIDSHTRFSFAFPLRSLNAKAVCECLLQVFSLGHSECHNFGQCNIFYFSVE